MIYNLPSNCLYGNQTIPVNFPDDWEIHESRIQGFDCPELTWSEMKVAVNMPFGTLPIREGAKGKKSAVIIIDDITRPTPCQQIAEIIVEELREAGIPKEQIWFVAALGAHGAMTREDFIRKLGEQIVEEYEVYNHNAFFNHVSVGTTTHGIPVEINSDVMEAEYKIAMGTMMPHSLFGFSGGAKSVLPGIASMKTIIKNHSFTSAEAFNMGNPNVMVRGDSEEATQMIGLDFKIDALLNGKAEICNLFAGNFREEAAAARTIAKEHYKAKYVPECDIVISNAYFKSLEAGCAYTPETIASLKKGGDYILSANSPYGCCVHYLYDKWGKTSPGGALPFETFGPDEKMKNMLVFSQYSVKGMRDTWFVEESKGAQYYKQWEDILKILDDGKPKKVVIYPMADSQILDNSINFYTEE